MDSSYRISLIDSVADWEKERSDWDAFANQRAFCRFDWLRRWWDHYGEGAELFILKVADGDGAVAYFPWQCRRSISAGRVLSFLGSGDVCSDYMTLIGRRADRKQWMKACVDWLTDRDSWDMIDLTGAVQGDAAVETLVRMAEEANWSVGRRTTMSCWRLSLPETWDEYLSRLSKSHRKQLRRIIQRKLETGDVVLREPADRNEFASALERLIELHQARWEAVGEAGAFGRSEFRRFVEEIASTWFDEGHCRIFELIAGDATVAAEIHFTWDGISFAYQSGVDPEARSMQAGSMLNAAIIHRLISEGWNTLDFLRGDEPYKAHFRAVPTPLVAWRLSAPRAPARLRHTAWVAAHTLKGWINGIGTTESVGHGG